jgi:hypothetical protein
LVNVGAKAVAHAPELVLRQLGWFWWFWWRHEALCPLTIQHCPGDAVDRSPALIGANEVADIGLHLRVGFETHAVLAILRTSNMMEAA